MRLPIPWADAFPLFQLIVQSPTGGCSLTVDDTHRDVDVQLPPGVNEDDVEIVGLFLGRDGQPVSGVGPVLIKERRAAAMEPVAEAQPQPEAAAETPTEPAAESEAEYPRRRRKPASSAEAASET
jgi:hypothetical protein